MSKRQLHMLEYIVFIIGMFATKYSISNANAYQYIRKFKGLDFLLRHYDVEHTLSVDDAIDDIIIVCKRNGGSLA